MTLTLLKDLYQYFTIAIVVVSLFYYRYLRSNIVGTLPVYVVVTTWLSIVVEKFMPVTANLHFVNMVIIPLEFLYFIVLYHFLSPKGKNRLLSPIFFLVYCSTLAADVLFFKQKYIYLFLFSYTTGTIILLVLVILYLYRLLNSDNLLRFYKTPGFWISTGILLFYVGTLPIHVFWNNVSSYQHPAFITTRYIFYTLMQLMYAGFILAITCTKWTEKK